ncbi:MAG TPA: TonB-dependent receptor [Clostridia bacterium]|nr:TonB-dependent receptor [Clostridia bacterium]
MICQTISKGRRPSAACLPERRPTNVDAPQSRYGVAFRRIIKRVSLRVLVFITLVYSVSVTQTSLLVTVVDENGVAVPGASIEMRGMVSLRCTTDPAGNCRFAAPAGSYEVLVTKVGHYQAVLRDVRPSDTGQLRVTLAHTQEIKESVQVTASPPAVDAQQVAAARSLDSTQIVNIPFPVTRDIRQALPFIPGVMRDRLGQIHLAGAETYQTLTVLDGFVISDPATGELNTRFSTDAVRAIDVQDSRYSAQFGPASGGVTAFTSISGDDRFRFSATNFVPSLKLKQGVHLDKVTPRVTFSGPIAKGRAWFLLAPDAEYDNNIVSELPPGQNSNTMWRISNLAKVQVNLTPRNIFTTSFLVNGTRTAFGGISPLTPIETTLKEAHSSYLATARDQIYLAGGTMIEVALAVSRYHDRALPLGSLPFVISPGIAHGNFYRSQWTSSGRLEPQLNVYLPRFHLGGTHEFRFGAVARKTDETMAVSRTPISILREDQTLYSRILFNSIPRSRQSEAVYGGFIEDRWAPLSRLLIEVGVRADHDTALGEAAFSPRIAATYMLGPVTKLSAGIGWFHDYPTLNLLGGPAQGSRTQYIYDATGTVVIGAPVTTTFVAPAAGLRPPGSRNWSFGLEHQLTRNLIVTADYIDRHTSHDFATDLLRAGTIASELRLGNNRTTQYRALQVSARATFSEGHELLAAYTRSTAHASAVLDYSIDNPVFSPQSAGPLSWDAPNKIISWGFLPVPHLKKWAFGYSGEWHTGFPFSVFNQSQQLVGAANSRRFPDFLMINTFLERRFTLKGYNLALRGGFEDITGSKNPLVVQNNVDAANFLQYSVTARRAFTARIRFLGRK